MFDYLLKLIREEKVILFVGAGCSIAAGYPNASGLGKIIYDDLFEEEKKDVNSTLPLDELAEVYTLIRNRNSLIQIVNNVFNIPPKTLDFHKKLGSIPHFKTVLTTNYDTLVEMGYQNKGQVIHNDNDCTYLSESKTHIFKIHGDLTFKDDIVITRSDYTRLFDSAKNPIMWNHIKDKLATNHILFLGYGIDDIDIDSILKKIRENLGVHLKKSYLIAPNWVTHKINNLIRNDIEYINLTGEVFIQELIKSIEENICDDVRACKVSIGTCSTFLAKYQIEPVFKCKDAKVEIQNLDVVEGAAEEFAINLSGKDAFGEILQKIKNPVLCYNPSPIEIPTNVLSEAIIKTNGITFLTKETLGTIKVLRVPSFRGKINVRVNKHFIFNNLPVKIFNSSEGKTCIVNLDILEIAIHSVRIEGSKRICRMDYTLKSRCKNIFSALHCIEFIEHLSMGGVIDIEINKKLHSREIQKEDRLLLYIKPIKEYYEHLLRIQQYYKCNFENFENYTKENAFLAQKIYCYIKSVRIYQKMETPLTINLTEENSGLQTKEDEVYLIFGTRTESPILISLLGHQFNIGYEYIILPNCILQKQDFCGLESESQITFIEENGEAIICYHDLVESLGNDRLFIAPKNLFNNIEEEGVDAIVERLMGICSKN